MPDKPKKRITALIGGGQVPAPPKAAAPKRVRKTAPGSVGAKLRKQTAARNVAASKVGSKEKKKGLTRKSTVLREMQYQGRKYPKNYGSKQGVRTPQKSPKAPKAPKAMSSSVIDGSLIKCVILHGAGAGKKVSFGGEHKPTDAQQKYNKFLDQMERVYSSKAGVRAANKKAKKKDSKNAS